MAANTVGQLRQPHRVASSGQRVLPLRAQTIVGLLFVVALLAFELFNFDTTRFALGDFLGDASFAGLRWATVLAIAFCAIDFAGLLRFFLPQDEEGQTPAEVWYLMGAWLLGATMNALMTWWAVNLALLNHDFGNEVLSRQQLLEVVPIFVATLVWVTRILFIGAFTVAGGYLFNFSSAARSAAQAHDAPAAASRQAARPLVLRPSARVQGIRTSALSEGLVPETDDLPPFLQGVDNQNAGEGEDFAALDVWPAPVSRRAHASVAGRD